MRRIEIEALIEEILEEGRDPREVSTFMVERFLDEYEIEGGDDDEEEVSGDIQKALEDIRDWVSIVGDEVDDIKHELDTTDDEDGIEELIDKIESFKEHRNKIFDDPDRETARSLIDDFTSHRLAQLETELNALQSTAEEKLKNVKETKLTGQRNVHTKEADRLGGAKEISSEPGSGGDGKSPSASMSGGDRTKTFTDKEVERNKKRKGAWATTSGYLSHFKLSQLFNDPKSRLYAGITSSIVLSVVIASGIQWVRNRDIRKIGILATNRAMMMADMEGLAVTPKSLKQAFKMMTSNPMIKRKIKIYLMQGKNVGQQFRAIDNVSNYVAKELIKFVKRTGVARVQPVFNTPRPTDPPTARGFIHPPGFADSIGIPGSGVGGDQEGTEHPGGSWAG